MNQLSHIYTLAEYQRDGSFVTQSSLRAVGDASARLQGMQRAGADATARLQGTQRAGADATARLQGTQRAGPDTLQGHAKSGEETEDTWYDLE